MQFTATQEQMEVVIPEWCAADGFGDDPVTVSRFKELAVRLLSILPGEASRDDCVLSRAKAGHTHRQRRSDTHHRTADRG